MRRMAGLLALICLLAQPIYAATFYLDFEGGSDAADGTSFANRWKTITSGATAARIAPGDTIRLMGSPAPTSLGQTATWTNLSQAVTLTSAVTANIDLAEGAWTASANVTTTTSSTRKQGSFSTSIAPAAAFTTGKAAYLTISLTDYSAYKQVTFWIRQSSGTVTADGDISIKLCSDTLGAVAVNTISIPATVVTGQWFAVTVDTGGALGSAINSIGFYVNTDRGAQTFLLDNIMAAKDSTSADSLTLQSLISKNTGNEAWYGIKSINGTAIKIDAGPNTSEATTTAGYYGTTESVTTYKRETVKPAMQTSASNSASVVQDSGTSGSLITFSGGWNRTDMSTQTLETWIDGRNGFGRGIDTNSQSFLNFEKLGSVRHDSGFTVNASSDLAITSLLGLNNNTGNGLNFAGTPIARNTFTTVGPITSNSGSGVSLVAAATSTKITTLISSNGNNSHGISSLGPSNIITNVGSLSNNLTDGINFSSGGCNNYVSGASAASPMVLNSNGSDGIETITTTCDGDSTFKWFSMTAGSGNCISPNSGPGGIYMNGVCSQKVNMTKGNPKLFNVSVTSGTEFSGAGVFSGNRAISVNHDQTANNHYIYMDIGTITSDASVRHTASGISWKFNPTSTNASADYPLSMNIGKVAVAASAQVTIRCWMRRSNTGLTGTLYVKGGQVAGVDSDVTSSMTVAADTWEEVSLNFTPTAAGVVEFGAYFYGGTTYSGYIDDITVTQA